MFARAARAHVVWCILLFGGTGTGGTGVPDIGGSDGPYPPRVLQQALPLVSGVDFQDLDIDVGEIQGTVSWVPPDDTSELSGYEVYLTDSIGTASMQTHFGSVAVPGASVVVPPHTSLTGPAGPRTHIFVFARSPLGMSPQGVGTTICDVGRQDTIFLVNAEAASGQWGVVELRFFPTPDCSGSPFRWVETGSSNHVPPHNASLAFDGDANSAWVSSCAGCPAGAISLGIIGVCQPQAVRCVRVRQCVPNVGLSCPATAGRMQQLRLLVQGQDICTWKVLKGLRPTGTEILQEEDLIVSGRRRRAGFTRFSESLPPPEQFTNPGFSSR